MKPGELLLEVVRNNRVESIHSGHLLILNSDGSKKFSLGDPDQIIFPRSAIKALQAAAMLRAGLKVTPAELALASASHAGSAMHREAVLALLDRYSLDESALGNSPDKPLDPQERLLWGEKKGSSLAANCSGKHGAMVVTCLINGWDLHSYKEPTHPLQRAIIAECEALTGEKISEIAVDGCGAPLFPMKLSSMAKAFHTMIASSDPIYHQVIQASRDFPEMVSGAGRLPTLLMERVPGLFVKDGAEAVMVIASAHGEVIVWKMSDGTTRGASTLASASLLHLGVTVDLEPENVMGDGKVVGEIRASRLVRYG
jgi:L-asparaginase II